MEAGREGWKQVGREERGRVGERERGREEGGWVGGRAGGRESRRTEAPRLHWINMWPCGSDELHV
jgi:hypothetical protein